MEVVELSDRAGGTEMVLQGEKRERGPNPSQRATDSHLLARARFAIKRGGEGGKIGTIPELYYYRSSSMQAGRFISIMQFFMGTDSARMPTNGLQAPSPRLFFFSSLVLWKDTGVIQRATEKPQKIPRKNCYYLSSFSLSLLNNQGLMGVAAAADSRATAHSHDTIFTVF